MIPDEIREKVAGFIRQNFLFDRNRALNPDVSLISTGILDSTGILELIAFIEEDFGVTFADDELVSENFDTIDSIVAILLKKMPKSA